MSQRQKLFYIKLVHTVIYLCMVWAVIYLLYAALTTSYTLWLYIALALLFTEAVVYAASGMKCPLTSLARKYGDTKGYVGDLFIPERYARYTFQVFGSLFLLGLIILLWNVVLH